MIYISYLISMSIGYLLLKLLITRYVQLPPFLVGMLSLGLGFGLSTYITFASFLIHGHYLRISIVLIHLVILILLIYIKRKETTELLQAGISKKIFKPLPIILSIVFVAFLVALYYLAKLHPHGEWDAWGMWNLKYKFLIFSNQPFEDIFKNLSWHTHPDYPLMLPFLNVWIYALTETSLYIVPFVTAILLTLSCAFLIGSGLRPFTKKIFAVLATGTLITHPFFLFTGTAQYADVLLAFYLLASLILIMLAAKKLEPRLGLLAGAFLGMMTFAKNEGLVMALMLIVISGIYFFISESDQIRLRRTIFYRMITGLIIFAIPTIIFKFIAPSNTDILPNLTMQNLSQLSINDIRTVFALVLSEMFQEKWCYIWFFFMALSVWGIKRLFKKEAIILSLFFICYITLLGVIYTTNSQTNLHWWVEYSAPRIYFYLLPSVLFFCLYIHKDRLS